MKRKSIISVIFTAFLALFFLSSCSIEYRENHRRHYEERHREGHYDNHDRDHDHDYDHR